MARSLNRVQLIGNLTRDPELRYTPSGTAVCSFGLATNRNWKTETGERREEAEFHNIVAWNKLAELCSQFLVKGRKVFVEGRLATRSWNAQDGTQKSRTEIIISDMILLDSRRPEATAEAAEVTSNATESAVGSDASSSEEPGQQAPKPRPVTSTKAQTDDKKQKSKKTEKTGEDKDLAETKDGDVEPSDIPF